jgi:hypothetical protein
MKKHFIFISGILLLLWSCNKKPSGCFQLLDASLTGIDFNNNIEENDSINVFQYMNIYTGAGVAVGDINNDGLTDVYFSGNMVTGRLYINKGDFKFEDISEQAGLINKRWGTGATMVDINQDGYLDIYVCVSGSGKESERANMLYINNGPSPSGQITFTEKAAEYGLADTRQCMHAAFFDYDKDNDLDMYLLVNPAAYEYQVNSSLPRKLNGESISNDRLYRNNGPSVGSGQVTFTDVSTEAGILVEGYGLGIAISDINNDNWPDIYVSNDFIGNDILYINQKDGTFKNEISKHINHTSYAGMGNDVSDIDNNGKPDIMVLDMRPEDNKRQKLIISSTGYDRFQMMLKAGYDPEYSRNTLQLNQGEGKFSEIGNMAGVSSTDWSWSPLFADYDNDGHKDLYVTNGFLRDLGNLDYIHYQRIYDNSLGDQKSKIKLKLNSIKELPPAKLVNYAYKNNGDLTFKKVSEDWGIKDASCSSGAAFADLDNDGDLDLLVNNMNQPAFVYKNTTNKAKNSNHFLKLKLKGEKGNLNGIGVKIEIKSKSGKQYYQHFLSRGFESSIDPNIHFGLGKDSIIESVKIIWPDNTSQTLVNIKANQLVEINKKDAILKKYQDNLNKKKKWFSDVTDALNVNYKHVEDNFVDFKQQPILPHMHSRNGPGVSVADVNNDGFEDFYIGGAAGQAGQLFLQAKDGSFTMKAWKMNVQSEDMGSLFFDVDNDGDQDLYIVSGGVQTSLKKDAYQDRLYVNDGNGNFTESKALPSITSSGSTVTACDFDKDGDLDLFIGGRVVPGKYPMPTKSYLLENHTERADHPKFKDISQTITDWEKLTMVTSAIWTDYDNDGWVDLIVVGEFMPITLLHNKNGKFKYVKNPKGLEKSEGWWNSISGSDFDSDGDIDYILGNLGLNSKYKVTPEEPLCIYAKDFDNNGNVDPIMCYYIEGIKQISHTRDEIISQISAMRSRFRTYTSYAETPFENSFLPKELDDAYLVKSYVFKNSYLENLGNGSFKLRALPMEVQMAPVKGIIINDIDQDGFEDLVLTGNSYGTDVATGRYDALMGIVLKGNGNGGFIPLSIEQSGFLNNFDGSGLAMMKDAFGNLQIIVANNDGPLKVFRNNLSKSKMISISKTDKSAKIFLKNGKSYKKEFYFGSGYLSQDSRNLSISKEIKKVIITNVNGKIKTVYETNKIN